MKPWSKPLTFNLAVAVPPAVIAGALRLGRNTERRKADAARKRRERRWNRALGRRADGHVIRPIA